MLLRSGIDTRSEKTEIPERMLVVLGGFFFFEFQGPSDWGVGEEDERMETVYVDNSKKRISIMGKAERG